MRLILVLAASAAMLMPAVAQPANPNANTPAVNYAEQPAESRRAGCRRQQLHRRTGEVPHRDERLLQRQRPAKDAQGVWRGKAMKGGKSVDVSVDFQGNVTPR